MSNKAKMALTIVIDVMENRISVTDRVIEKAILFKNGLETAMAEKYETLVDTSIRVILFKDFYNTGEKTINITESPWFSTNDDKKFKNYIIESESTSSNNDAKLQSEALSMAFKNQPQKQFTKYREVILLLTDFIPNSSYKSLNLEELEQIYMKHRDRRGKRFIIIAPEHPIYMEMVNTFESTIFIPSQVGVDISKEILKLIYDSVVYNV